MLRKIYNKLVAKFKAENRSDLVIYVLLSGFLIIAIACLFIVLFGKIFYSSEYNGDQFSITIVFVLVLAAIWGVFKIGYRRIISYIFLIFVLFGLINIALASGVENPFSLLLMVFYIILASILFKGQTLFSAIFVVFLAYFSIAVLEVNNLISPDLAWKSEKLLAPDIIAFVVFLSIIVLISWLFNREINNYISELEKSEKLLKKERNLLEVRVRERTKELQEAQADKMSEIAHVAEFGNLARGLFHDLANPLTALSLNLGQLKEEKDTTKIQKYFQEATVAANNMRELIESSVDYSKNKMADCTFSIAEELKNVSLICNYKAQKANVAFDFQKNNDVSLIGNKSRFSQLICNLVINAIEAFDSKASNKKIKIRFRKMGYTVEIRVIDNASGMTKDTIKHLFEPFYSTKSSESNSGIGLTTCKDIVETDFLGTIAIQSELGKGSEFTITLPANDNK